MTKEDIIKKRYPFYNPDDDQDIEVCGDSVKQLMGDLIDVIIDMYVPDGNPEIWLNKINELRSS